MDPIDRLLRLAADADLPGIERSTSYGTPSLKVRGKFLGRLFDADTLVIRCPVEETAMLMQTEPQFYFQTDHYRGYEAMLVRLAYIDDARLAARLERAWSMQAGPRETRARAKRRG